MSRYIPFPAYADDAPLDLSFIYKNEKPAGKHGFLTVEDDKLVFENGTIGRFWGTNFNGGMNFPDFEFSEKTAKRLAKIGINIVRFHQIDSEWNTPNIFQFTKGERRGDTLSIDPESIKRLDYLIYCLKQNGIYCYMDMFTYRKFKSGDGVAETLHLGDAAKPYNCYNRRLIDLQKRFARDLWSHINPYTGLAYKDDPVFVMAEIVNEADLFSRPINVEPYVKEFRDLFAAWLKDKNSDYDAYSCDVNSHDKEIIDFKIYLQEKYYIEIIDYMRDIGVKIPITGTNWTINSANLKTQLVTDFTDSHVYYYDWRWGETEKRCMNKAITETGESGFGTLAVSRVFDKPFFVSEWDMPWPNEYRAESPILYAAVGAFQGWSGFAIHTYAYGTRLDKMDILGKESSSASIGGVPYREGIFSTWNDPAKFGLFYHSALITRRGDISPAENEITVALKNLARFGKGKAFDISAELSKIGSSFEDNENFANEDAALVDESKGEVRSDNGQLYRNWHKNYGTIDSPMTKCVYGFLAKNSPLELDGLKINAKTDFAVIALSSLTDKPIESSDNILLTTVGRSKNTDAVFEGELMTNYGRAPILIEVIEAELILKTSCENLKVWAVSAEGFFVGVVPFEYKDGNLHIKLGETFPSMYYLIQSE